MRARDSLSSAAAAVSWTGTKRDISYFFSGGGSGSGGNDVS